MLHLNQSIHIFINQRRFEVNEREHTGRSIKERADIPVDHVLCLEVGHHPEHPECGCERFRQDAELKVVSDEEFVVLSNREHFWSHAPAVHPVVNVTINGNTYEFADPHQTGRSLKERAQIPLADVLFLERPSEDAVVPEDLHLVLKCGDRFHSAPPANYGGPAVTSTDVGGAFQCVVQPGGWTFLVIPSFSLPQGFSRAMVRLLVKLPPAFPDAAPDMFWVSPDVHTSSGAAPQGTSVETLLGEPWQRFSWHPAQGAWRPGISTLRDYLRCVRARFEKRN